MVGAAPGQQASFAWPQRLQVAQTHVDKAAGSALDAGGG